MTTSTFGLPSLKQRRSLESATSRYAANVERSTIYLARRGISLDVARAWRLGVVEDPLPGHEPFQGRLCIPYLSPSGVLDLKFRCIRDHDCKTVEGHQKYLAPEGSQARLFGVWNLRSDSPFICLCEGELDVIACTSLAGLPAVGISGARKWRDHWAYVFEGYEEVLILGDGDKSGRDMASSVASRLYNSRIVTMPEGHDVNSLIVEQGVDALIERMGFDEDDDD